jgi:hypothetical protein
VGRKVGRISRKDTKEGYQERISRKDTKGRISRKTTKE